METTWRNLFGPLLLVASGLERLGGAGLAREDESSRVGEGGSGWIVKRERVSEGGSGLGLVRRVMWVGSRIVKSNLGGNGRK